MLPALSRGRRGLRLQEPDGFWGGSEDHPVHRMTSCLRAVRLLKYEAPWRRQPRLGTIRQHWTHLFSILCGTCFLPGLRGDTTIQAALNSTVVLPCHHAIASGTPPTDLRVYWQRGETVLYALNEGNPEPQHQNETYLHRTSVDPRDLSLSLSGVQVSDEGSYTCHVQKKESSSFKTVYHGSVQLTVAAAYSQPVISQQEKDTDNTRVNLTCQSQGGYPQPTVVWYNLTGQGVIPTGPANTSLLQDPWSQQYNVSSRIEVEASPALLVGCSVLSQHLPAVNSTPFEVVISRPVPGVKDTIPIVAGIACTIVVLVASYVILKNYAPCSEESRQSTSYTPPAEQTSDDSLEDTHL